MKNAIPKFEKDDTVTINFVHFVTKQPAVFQFDCNPTTGDWLFTQNGKAMYWYEDVKEVKKLIKNVVEKSHKHNCQCDVVVEKSKHPMHNL